MINDQCPQRPPPTRRLSAALLPFLSPVCPVIGVVCPVGRYKYQTGRELEKAREQDRTVEELSDKDFDTFSGLLRGLTNRWGVHRMQFFVSFLCARIDRVPLVLRCDVLCFGPCAWLCSVCYSGETHEENQEQQWFLSLSRNELEIETGRAQSWHHLDAVLRFCSLAEIREAMGFALRSNLKLKLILKSEVAGLKSAIMCIRPFIHSFAAGPRSGKPWASRLTTPTPARTWWAC